MTKTLHGRLAVLLLGLLVLLGLLFVSLTLATAQRYFQEVNQRLNRPLARSLADSLAARGLVGRDSRTLAAARAEIKRLMVINPSIEVYLLDADGTVLASSVEPKTLRRARVSLPPLRRFLFHADPLPILGDDPRDRTGRKIFSAATVRIPARFDGYLYVILGGQNYDSTAGQLGRSLILRSSAAATAAIVLLAGLAGWTAFRLLTRRLRQLAREMEEWREDGARVIPWPNIAPPRDEIDRLGIVYLQMSNRIRGQIQQLQEADRQRRELVSNVSHDLRTPLAALQGYLETLLMKEGGMTAQEQRGYLQIASRQSERLANLVAQLFELAKLDGAEGEIRPEPFSLGELVQDVMQEYRVTAQERQIRLETNFPQNLPFVCADISLVERVLENLTENAFHHTLPGGAVTIALRAEADRIQILVSDTGSGIRPEDLSHIFERSFRAPHPPVGEEVEGAGLGLAIAKRILELHGSAIQARSVVGEGTVFTFSLPVCPPPSPSFL